MHSLLETPPPSPTSTQMGFAMNVVPSRRQNALLLTLVLVQKGNSDSYFRSPRAEDQISAIVLSHYKSAGA